MSHHFLVHQFGLFQFKTGNNSAPPTPTARSKVAIFGLDAISRNLFNTRPGSAMGDFFAGSISGKRSRSRSIASRSSMYTHTTTTNVDSLKSSHRSNSTATAATTVSSMDDESLFASRSSKGVKKASRIPHSQGVSPTDLERHHGRNRSDPASRPQSRASSRPPSRCSELEYSDGDDTGTILARPGESMLSEDHIDKQLELARKNSLTQHNKQLPPLNMDVPLDETILEGLQFFLSQRKMQIEFIQQKTLRSLYVNREHRQEILLLPRGKCRLQTDRHLDMDGLSRPLQTTDAYSVHAVLPLSLTIGALSWLTTISLTLTRTWRLSSPPPCRLHTLHPLLLLFHAVNARSSLIPAMETPLRKHSITSSARALLLLPLSHYQSRRKLRCAPQQARQHLSEEAMSEILR